MSAYHVTAIRPDGSRETVFWWPRERRRFDWWRCWLDPWEYSAAPPNYHEHDGMFMLLQGGAVCRWEISASLLYRIFRMSPILPDASPHTLGRPYRVVPDEGVVHDDVVVDNVVRPGAWVTERLGKL